MFDFDVRKRHIYFPIKLKYENLFGKILLHSLISFDDATGETRVMHNPKYLYISDHPHRILTVCDSEGVKNILVWWMK